MNIIEKKYTTNGRMDIRSKTERIILHHAEAYHCTVEDIDRWHKQRGFCKIGYHFFVDKEGNIYRGREENTVGAHAYGSNYNSIGICAEGKYMEETMPEEQKKSIIELVNYLKEKYNINVIQKHRDVCATSCPGDKYPFDEIVKGMIEPTVKVEGKVADIQTYLNNTYGFDLVVDNIYGNKTKAALVKALQTELNTQFNRRLIVDGIFGSKTKAACITVRNGATGNITYLIKAMLICHSINVALDNRYNNETVKAVKEFQERNNLVVDGLTGKNTFERLFK